jgi:phosphomannomutase
LKFNCSFKKKLENKIPSIEKRMSTTTPKRICVLFDVDGTLTPSRKRATPEMLAFLAELRSVPGCVTGMVGGSDLPKQKEQLGEDVLHMFDYVFPENGTSAFYKGERIGATSVRDFLGEDTLKALINFVLGYLSQLDIPVKRGTFLEYRQGMLNISPIGRNCSQAERDEFEAFDLKNDIRKTMISALREKFPNIGLKYSIGGQISFDAFPIGWDKTFCLQFLNGSKGGEAAPFDEIHFFGDKTFEGGNDFEIFSHPSVIGHTVTGPEDTMKQCKDLFINKSAAK